MKRFTWQARILVLFGAVILITWFAVASCTYLADRESSMETPAPH